MNKEEYMQRLANALDGVPQSEKEEALQYYNDYFDDAGAETVQGVIKSLGSPENLAKTIKGEQDCQMDFGDMDTYEDDTYSENSESVKNEEKNEKTKLGGGWIALIIVLAILAAPIIFSVSAGVADGFFEVIELFFEGIMAVAAFIVIIFYMMIACIGAAFSIAASAPFGAVILAGVGVFLVGICIFLIMAVVWLLGVAIPWCIKGIINLFKKKGDK